MGRQRIKGDEFKGGRRKLEGTQNKGGKIQRGR